MQVLRQMKEMACDIDLDSIRPGDNARACLNVCFKNKMAWRLAGPQLRGQLIRTFEVEHKGRIREIEIDKQDMRYFLGIMLIYDLQNYNN